MEDLQQPPEENICQKRIDQSVRERLCQFLSSTDCHGCNNLVQTSYPRRYIWACLILSSTGFLTFSLVKEFQDFYSYPTFTKLSYEQMDEMRFPAVTICNLSPYNQKKIDLHKDDPIFKTYMLKNNEELNQNGVNQTHLNMTKYTEYMWKVAYDLNMFIVYVDFDNIILNVSRSMTRKTTNIGPCFSFNSDGKTTTKMSGRKHNLLMFFDINQWNYTNYELEAGVLVSIEDPGHAPDIFNMGTMVPPGVSAEIRMSKVESKFLPYPYKMKDGTYCINSRDPNYSKKRCLDTCVSRAILATCHCILVEDLIDGPICLPSETSKCYSPMYAQFRSNASFKTECACTDSCTTTVYESTMSVSQYPSEKEALNNLPSGLNSNMIHHMTSAMRNDRLSIRIYFDHLRTTTIEQVPKYDSVIDVLANLGGQMGLFLGISVLTVVEFGEMLFLIMCTVTKKIRQRGHKARPLMTKSLKKMTRENQQNQQSYL